MCTRAAQAHHFAQQQLSLQLQARKRVAIEKFRLNHAWMELVVEARVGSPLVARSAPRLLCLCGVRARAGRGLFFEPAHSLRQILPLIAKALPAIAVDEALLQST